MRFSRQGVSVGKTLGRCPLWVRYRPEDGGENNANFSNFFALYSVLTSILFGSAARHRHIRESLP